MKILFVAMHNSTHTASWISQLTDEKWDLHLFSVYDYDCPHDMLPSITVYHLHNVKCNQRINPKIKIKNILPFYLRLNISNRLLSRFRPKFKNRAFWLAKLISELKPDIIHSLEMQHASYLALEAKKYLKEKFPPWIYSCWGSDIYYFMNFEEHKPKIKEVLANCDYLFTDCKRDVLLAQKLGFKRKLLGVYPGVGGFKIDKMLYLANGKVLPSERKLIVVKGYNGWVYRSFIILKALEDCATELQGYTIVVYLADEEVIKASQILSEKIGVEIKIFPRSSYDEVLKLFASARIAVASSISDGTPNSMLEAMTMGAFPIQSNTVSTAEWITDAENGFLVEPEDVAGFTKCMKEALKNNELVNKAAKLNIEMLRKRIDYSLVQPKVIEAYKAVAEGEG